MDENQKSLLLNLIRAFEEEFETLLNLAGSNRPNIEIKPTNLASESSPSGEYNRFWPHIFSDEVKRLRLFTIPDRACSGGERPVYVYEMNSRIVVELEPFGPDLVIQLLEPRSTSGLLEALYGYSLFSGCLRKRMTAKEIVNVDSNRHRAWKKVKKFLNSNSAVTPVERQIFNTDSRFSPWVRLIPAA